MTRPGKAAVKLTANWIGSEECFTSARQQKDDRESARTNSFDRMHPGSKKI